MSGEWIKCSERMPEFGEQVMVCVSGGILDIAQRELNGDFWNGDYYEEAMNITHWMPLPTPPEEP